ncbi:hypothetical protein ACIRRA_36225 [Nocardia sp. NPDC101769]|uniref:hypothetical protein n=1 Tax=Nocardia sp. NPDC101769 TaxID=3364333 RepID=UPI0037FB89FD
MANGKFSAATKALVAARAGYMCTNPDCNRLLVGPEVKTGDVLLKSNIGKFAHIQGREFGSARHNESMTEEQRSDAANAIFLCGVCHDLVDNNGGPGYSVTLLTQWRDEHTAKVRQLLASPRLPLLPELMRLEHNAKVVQQVFDTLADKRSLHCSVDMEFWPHVIKALRDLRSEMNRALREITDDDRLRKELEAIRAAARNLMKNVIVEDNGWPSKGEIRANQHLDIMREEIGSIVHRLAKIYNIPAPQELRSPTWTLGVGLRHP